jgi:ketosteroid isomerase-like protein
MPSLRARRFGRAAGTLSPSYSVEVRRSHADCDCVVVHSGRNEMPDDRRYDNNYCWVLWGPLNDGRSEGTRNSKDDPSHPALRVP